MGTTLRKRMLASVIAAMTVLNFFIIPVAAAEGDVKVKSWSELKSAVSNAKQATIVLDSDISITAREKALEITGGKDITLDLNGHTISRDSSSRTDNSFITVQNTALLSSAKAKFTLTDNSADKSGKITGSNGGRAIAVGENGEFTMLEGSLTGNASSVDGGGVVVAYGGVFTMMGGKISGNTGVNGGGVSVEYDSTFVMVDGVIDGNTATELGAGIYLADGSKCTIYGGSITNNIAKIDRDNNQERGAGIYFGHQAQLNFGDEKSAYEMKPIVISGNKDEINGQDGKITYRDDNLYISFNNSRTHVIHANQTLAEGTSIGLCVSFYNNSEDVAATVGYLNHNNVDDANAMFFMDQAERSLAIINNELHCVKHVHKLSYTVDGNVLHVECTAPILSGKNSFKCTQKADLTLIADDAKFTGDAVEATLDGVDAFRRLTGIEADPADIKYYAADDEDNALASAPSKAGEYIAKYTVTAAGTDYTIVKAFAIACEHDWDEPTYYWSDDNSTCTATRVCKFDASHKETETVDVTSKVTQAATCEAAGVTELTAEFKNAAFTTQTKTIADPEAAGHKEEIIQAVEATCTDAGSTEGKKCSVCGAILEEPKEIPALGHDWGEVDYKWSDDNSTCTATRVCSRDPEHKETETVDSTAVVTKEASCEEAGEKTFTAKFENAAFTEQTTTTAIPAAGHKEETIPAVAATCTGTGLTEGKKCSVCGKILEEQKEVPALGHDWGEPTYEWSDDFSTCTATRVCSRDSEHKETEIADATSEVTKFATCEENGVTTYTATFKNVAFSEQTATSDIPAKTGHDWDEPTYVWSDDNSTCTATRICKNDPSHIEKETVDSVAAVTTPATCEADGETTYTATFKNAAFAEQTTKADIPAMTGHDWDEPTYSWSDDLSTCTATRVCKNDKAHVETETVDATSEVTKAATCEEDGVTTYTATFKNAAFAEQKTTSAIPAKTGHDWGEPTYEWSADNSKVTATRVCKNDKSHVEKETVAATSKVTKAPTVDAKGVRTFTSASFKNPAFSIQTKNVDIAKLKPTPTPTLPADDPSIVLKIGKANIALPCGKTETIKATLVGSSAKITWKSSDPKIASVDANGKITAKMAGSVAITATAVGKKATCSVQVLFKDVTNSKDFWYTPTYYLTNKEVVKGYDNQTMFKPANICTRAQMVTFIWRLVGEPAPKTTTCKFKDVKKTDYFYKACLWGNEKHIVEGYEDGTFGPKINCARRHAVTFLWRLAGKPEPSTTKNKFSDLKKDAYFYKATLWASEKKILEGYSDGTFRPNGNCLRRQMVTFLYKYDKFINNKG